MVHAIDWETLADFFSDVVVRVDHECRHLYVNRYWSEATGVRPEDAWGKTPREIGLPNDLCEMLEFATQKVIAERTTYQFEFPHYGPRGEQHFSARVIPEFGPDGEVGSLLSVTRNITDQVKAEAALVESEDRFRAFMNHSPCVSWMKDAEGRLVFLSETFERQFQIRLQDWAGKTDAELWSADVAKKLRENDLAVLRDGQTREVIEETRDANGETRSWQSFKFLIQDASGRKFVGGTAVDITVHRQAELASARLAAIVDSSHDAIISKTLDGIIQTWNPSAERIFGYTAEEMIGRSIETLIPPEFHHEEAEILYRIRQGELIGHYETVRVRQDGQRIPVSLTMSPIRDYQDRIIAASKIVRELNVPQRLRLARQPIHV